jgi:hypothetical protein
MKNSRKNNGRPTGLTPAIIREISKWLRRGCCEKTAANAAGISTCTFNAWRREAGAIDRRRVKSPSKGEVFKSSASDQMLLNFLSAIRKASALGEIGILRQIHRAAEAGHWQASAWRLERNHPQRWGRRIHAEIVERERKTYESKCDCSKLTDEERQELQRLLGKVTWEPATTPTTGCPVSPDVQEFSKSNFSFITQSS